MKAKTVASRVVSRTEDGATLGRIPLFARLSQAEREQLATWVSHRTYRRGETLFHEGDPGDTLLIVVSGQVKVVLTTADGEEAVVAIFGPGDFFGDLSLLDGRPRSAAVVALEPTETLVLHRRDFHAFLRTHPVVIEELFAVLADRIRRLDEQLKQTYFLDLPVRLAHKLLQLGIEKGHRTPDGIRIDLPLTQSDLASMIGASRQRVNRVLAELQDKQIIRLERRGLTILQPEYFERLIVE
jgi:CRP/FNR family cyclic AMP-dependent transcriptional regulator